MKKRLYLFLLLAALFSVGGEKLCAQKLLANVYGRHYVSLNGEWNAIVDLYGQGRRMQVYKNRKPTDNKQFYEYSFDRGLVLNVPGDWNSQMPELKYYEGTVWYGRHLNRPENAENNRLYLYFGAVSYRCKVYLNGEEIASHEGGFTPFQVEVTDKLRDIDNFLALEVNNTRTPDAIPAMSFDWWNYGGITRDVMLICVPQVHIADYFVQLDKYRKDLIHATVTLSEAKAHQAVQISIPELKVRTTLETDNNGVAKASIPVKKLQRWSPEMPKLYDVSITASDDHVNEKIGFRNLFVKGEDVFLNDRPVFLRSISFHEEIPQRSGRAFSESDAVMLLSEAKALGANMIRLAHYPQNEYTVRLAEKMGFLLWEEIPIWQGIDFKNNDTRLKAGNMIAEMVQRDKNRCALSFWGIANETATSEPRNEFLKYLKKRCVEIDSTRLIVAAFDLAFFNKQTQKFEMNDTIINILDVVAVNKYMGWYHDWPVTPDKAVWNVASGKPLIISEFGGEALYGKHGEAVKKSSWSEDYQAQLYRDNLKMFENIPNLRGISPWVLFDFRSPFRFHPYQGGEWNRKGLVSDQGQRKKAWYIMNEYYKQKRLEDLSNN